MNVTEQLATPSAPAIRVQLDGRLSELDEGLLLNDTDPVGADELPVSMTAQVVDSPTIRVDGEQLRDAVANADPEA